jgi:ABC-type branched-subunit amino acid transport system permease subunit
MWFVMHRILRAPLGRSLRAIRDDHVAAAALGKDTFRMQLKSMMIGSFFAGIGGGLLIQFGGSFNPTAWLPGETFVVFAVLIVGGAGNNVGMFVGALLVETLLVHLPAFLPEIPGHPGLIEYIDLAVVGVVLMLMLWFRPQGIVPERLRRTASFGAPEMLDEDAGRLDQTAAIAAAVGAEADHDPGSGR